MYNNILLCYILLIFTQEKKFKALKEGKGKKSVACGKEKKAGKSTVRGMELFPSSDEEEEENTFMGFTQQDILEV